MTSPRAVAIPVLAAAAILCAILLSPYQLGILALVATYAVASLAQNLLTGYADMPSLGNVAFFAASAYTAGLLLMQTHMPAALALLCGILAAAALGVAVGLPALRISGMHLAIVTVALVFVMQEVMTQQDAARGLAGITVAQPGWLLGDRGLFLTSIGLAALSYAAVRNLLRSSTGRGLVAEAENRPAAIAAGVDPVRSRLLAFVVSSTLTGAAGIVYLYHLQTITPGAFPLDLSVAFLAMMTIGGSRTLGGSLVGAAIIGLLPQALRLLPATVGSVSVEQNVNGLYAVLLLLAMRFFPDGIWPGVTALWDGRRRVRSQRGGSAEARS